MNKAIEIIIANRKLVLAILVLLSVLAIYSLSYMVGVFTYHITN